jgi:eukaryotic-like serine/threonine-protein kinase
VSLELDDTLPQGEASQSRAAELSRRTVVPPGQVPGYEIDGLIGQGAFGSVWLAREVNTGKRVAIKFYNHRRGLDWSLLQREVEKLATLYTSRQIIGLVTVGWDADPPYYVMEYLEHGSLANLLGKGPVSVSSAVEIATDIARALVHAHRQGILHCDLKPANVLLDEDDRPRLADFGQSRLATERDGSLGTLFYMAPEQADVSAVPSARWDVYALGALIYEMLTGAPPHRTRDSERKLSASSKLTDRLTTYRTLVVGAGRPTEHRRRNWVDGRLAEIVDRCLEADPARRFPDAEAVLRALDSRANWRARRPFVMVPALLLVALIPMAYRAMQNAARTAEGNLATRALESDLVSAKILARALEQSLEARKFQLQQIAQDRRVPEQLKAGLKLPPLSPERVEMGNLLKELRDAVDVSLAAQHMAVDDSWFVTDEQGVQRWRDPASAETLDMNFSHRDYFHGRGSDFPPGAVPQDVGPIRNAHVSKPYRSTNNDQYKIAISVPVRDPDSNAVIAVLARTIPLGQLLSEYKSLLKNDDVQRVIALVDLETWQLLDHPWMTSENLSGLSPERIQRELRLDASHQAQLTRLLNSLRNDGQSRGEDRLGEYSDPIGKLAPDDSAYSEPWLAAMCPVDGTPWATIVQERRETALQPVREIRGGLVTYALGGLAMCLVLVAALWVIELGTLDRPTRSGKNGTTKSAGETPR